MATVVNEPITVLGTVLEPGTEVAIKREAGTFRFVKATKTSSGRIVLDFIGGPAGHEQWRSFYPERVKKILPAKPKRGGKK